MCRSNKAAIHELGVDSKLEASHTRGQREKRESQEKSRPVLYFCVVRQPSDRFWISPTRVETFETVIYFARLILNE